MVARIRAPLPLTSPLWVVLALGTLFGMAMATRWRVV